jgi:phosphohistidine phosphatase
MVLPIMKTLVLLRHAKSSWENTEISDFDRPLNSRGLKDAPIVGQNIKNRNIEIELILCSPAKRTKVTAILVRASGEIKAELRFDENIYEASSLNLLKMISKIEDSVNSVLIVGHNPGSEDLIRILTNQIQLFPTAALAKISLPIETWSDVSNCKGNLDFLLTPKNN